MLLAFFATSKVTKEAGILQEGFSLIFCRVKLLPDSNIFNTIIAAVNEITAAIIICICVSVRALFLRGHKL